MRHTKGKITVMAAIVLAAIIYSGSMIQGRLAGQIVGIQAISGPTLDPTAIPKYITPLVIPPVMPMTSVIKQKSGKNIEYYEIAVRQFQQQILPVGLPKTTVWSYASANHPGTLNYPAFTIEAKWNKPLRVKWINDLKDPLTGNYLPHILPIDQTLHWANPAGPIDDHGSDPNPYTGPVPIITHVHGAHTFEESDGYPEAWYLPAATNLEGYFTVGSFYDQFNTEFQMRYGAPAWTPGTATFQYPNDQRATTLWYHDHTLGMTRANVYAGPAGFYIIRGGADDMDLGYRAPKANDNLKANILYTEIPIAIQDRSFNADGSLFYPDNRAFFEGLNTPPDEPYLDIPFHPAMACDGAMSDIASIWNPEFFGNTMVVNGNTWPVLNVEARRYRLRFLNGCNSRFLVLKMAQDADAIPGIDDGNWTALPGMFWQIGAEGGFLAAPVQLDDLLMAPAERADVIIDFSVFAAGTEIYLVNVGPDKPFGGGIPGVDFPLADSATTGQVMKFVVGPVLSPDPTLPADGLTLPAIIPLGPATNVRQVSLNEEDSSTVRVTTDVNGNVILDCDTGVPFGPKAALLGTVMFDTMGVPMGMPMIWADAITENPAVGATEIWEIYNFTMDAHPIHIHLVQFQVVDRQPFDMMTGALGVSRLPEVWEMGFKDTVIAYPGEITRVISRFDYAGLYVWHCHIVEHEDNEMMRPYRVGN